jgi:hypothetical protein
LATIVAPRSASVERLIVTPIAYRCAGPAAAAATALAFVSWVPAAQARQLRLVARDGARVHAALPAKLRGQHVRLTVDGQHRTVVRRPATFSVNGLAGQTARWHRLRVHGRRTTASARFAVGSRSGRRSPTLVLTHAPTRTTAATSARFAYSASGGRLTCTIDGRPTACTQRKARVSVGPGRHVFALVARSGQSATTLSYAWTVSGPAPAAPDPAPAPAPAPAPGPAPVPPTAPTAPATGAPAGAGSATPGGWRLLMADGFDGTTLDTGNWQAYGPDWPGNGGNGLRDGSAVSVGGGVLTITAQMVGRTLVSGAVASRVSTTYGRVEFRVRADPDPSGATSAVVLMWPTSGSWPIDGETDIFETGTEPQRDWFSSFVHYGADNQQKWIGHDADATQWHTMALEWTPASIRFYLDGTLDGEVTDPAAISDAAQHLCIQLDAFSPTMSGTVRMQVDDVRLYALGG